MSPLAVSLICEKVVEDTLISTPVMGSVIMKILEGDGGGGDE